MRIAIVGSGISGLSAAHWLNDEHDIQVFEAQDRLGGHSNTVTVSRPDGEFNIDTGFIVFNERNYPNFCSLMASLGVESKNSEMSFSFRCGQSGLEYNGASLDTLFAQRRNLLRPGFYKMIREILRFNRSAGLLLDAPDDMSMGDFLDANNFSGAVVDDYLLPMAAAIWSSEAGSMRAFPARRFGEFFTNHGLMQLADRPQWRTITGGSIRYIDKLTAPFRDKIRTSAPVESIERQIDCVMLKVRGEETQRFDQVVIACHSDQALKMLSDPSQTELSILSAIPYQANTAVLHTDTRLLPENHKARAAWNYYRPASDTREVSVTYDLTALQSLRTDTRFLVTLNDVERIDPQTIIREISYDHPFFNMAGMRAQKRIDEINGPLRTWYCGAYWGYGFHEDGVKSALKVRDGLQNWRDDAQLHLSRTG